MRWRLGREQRFVRRRSKAGIMASTAYQTAWALLALLAVGESQSEAVRRGVAFLLREQQADGSWSDPSFTAPGFPARVLSALSRLLGVFPAMGARGLPRGTATAHAAV
jgi:squalene cyclase